MLDFLDTLCRVLAARDRLAIHRQLRHPLARALPPTVRSEALAIARGGPRGHLPPTRAYHFYYQTLQLLAASEPTPFERAESTAPDQHAERRSLATAR